MNTCSMLIVDDDELYLRLVKSIVEGAGVKARKASAAAWARVMTNTAMRREHRDHL